MIRMAKRKIKSLIFWSKVIWNDEDWDNEYFLIIMRRKLEKMNKYFSRKDVFIVQEEADLIARQIRDALDEVEYLISYQYDEDGMKEYYEKYPIVENFNFQCLNFGEFNAELFNKGVAKSEKLYEKSCDKLFTNLKTNMRGWWD